MTGVELASGIGAVYSTLIGELIEAQRKTVGLSKAVVTRKRAALPKEKFDALVEHRGEALAAGAKR